MNLSMNLKTLFPLLIDRIDGRRIQASLCISKASYCIFQRVLKLLMDLTAIKSGILKSIWCLTLIGCFIAIPLQAQTVTSTISVGSSPYSVAFSPDGSKAYVANTGSNNVSVINTANNTVTSTVAVGGQPSSVTEVKPMWQTCPTITYRLSKQQAIPSQARLQSALHLFLWPSVPTEVKPMLRTLAAITCR